MLSEYLQRNRSTDDLGSKFRRAEQLNNISSIPLCGRHLPVLLEAREPG